MLYPTSLLNRDVGTRRAKEGTRKRNRPRGATAHQAHSWLGLSQVFRLGNRNPGLHSLNDICLLSLCELPVLVHLLPSLETDGQTDTDTHRHTETHTYALSLPQPLPTMRE